LILLGAALLLSFRRPRTDIVRAAFLVWGGSLLLTGAVFSLAQGIIHPYYTVALAPAIGALVGMGGACLWQRRSELLARLAMGGGVPGGGGGGRFVPPGGALGGGFGGGQLGRGPNSAFGGGGGNPGGGGFLDSSRPAADLVSLLEANASRYTWVAATTRANSAAGYELATGDPVMAIGGFNGTDP